VPQAAAALNHYQANALRFGANEIPLFQPHVDGSP
jgi:hypothetical protein